MGNKELHSKWFFKEGVLQGLKWNKGMIKVNLSIGALNLNLNSKKGDIPIYYEGIKDLFLLDRRGGTIVTMVTVDGKILSLAPNLSNLASHKFRKISTQLLDEMAERCKNARVIRTIQQWKQPLSKADGFFRWLDSI